MKAVKGFLTALILVLIVAGVGAFLVINYSWVFSKRVRGEVIGVERVTAPTAVLGNRVSESQMYSYSVLIQAEDGKLYSAASEDRQWQVVKKGYCVDALLYRYPPWKLEQGNTFFNARVEQIRVCPGQTSLPDAEPTPPPAAPQLPKSVPPHQ
jgi:hypothetical protein